MHSDRRNAATPGRRGGAPGGLFSEFAGPSGWRIWRRRDPYRWRILSGTWAARGQGTVICSAASLSEAQESIAVVGPRREDLVFQVACRLLTPSLRPPEGGAIFFFLFRNRRNYYSCHLCSAKQRVEFIRRVRGVWTHTAGRDLPLETKREYRVEIRSAAGLHACWIDGRKRLEVRDATLRCGRVGIGAKYCDVAFGPGSLQHAGAAAGKQGDA